MNVITPMQMPGARSLPAELMIPRQYRRVDWGQQRLLAGGPNRMQSQGGVRGLMGITGVGDSCLDSATPGMEYLCNTTVYDPNTGGGYTPDPGINWNAINNAIAVSSTSIAKILAASNPGTYYKDQNGVVYSQPTGSTAVLPVGGSYGASGSVTAGGLNATFGGINMGMVAVIGVGLMLMMTMGRR